MSDKKHIQKTLTPIILEEGMPGFEIVRDIEEKLNDPEAFNIAITGPYGSGKSTVLKSLKAHYPDGHKYLTISLASLTGENEDPNLDEKELQKIEYSILQQLIYKEKPETLPNSRFIRLKQKSLCSTIWFGVGIICFILSFLVVFEPQWMRVETLCRVFDFGETGNLVFDILCSAYMVFCIFKITAYCHRHSTYNRIRALNVKDVKIELNQESSVFNKHLEEIVYFFESTDYNVVIIEDLDRFRCPGIFQKLRELNFLLRQSEVLKDQKRSIKFIYAIKDDLFKDVERTKFFDYIATVIPVVNPKNSYEKLTKELTERGYTLKKETLRDLSEFVDDMRMLKNVANEFQQYVERLSTSGTPNQEKLLAMIIYKNHHPDDFGRLHFKDGKVFRFIKQKPEWLQMAVEKVIKPRIEVWEKKREEVVNSQKLTLKQWRIIYMEKYRERLGLVLNINAKGSQHPINDFIESAELFEDLIRQKKVLYGKVNGNLYGAQNVTTDIDFVELEKEVDDKIGYKRRTELANISIAEIDNEIRMVREEENRLKNFTLAKLLIRFPEIKKSEQFKELELTELMVHFLQRGYIDETYYDYLTLFDGTSMSLNDRDLLTRIRQNDDNVNYDEKIDDIDAFMEELPLFVYEYKSLLNYQIADFLEKQPVVWQPALKTFEQHFINSSLPALDFMANYYKRGSEGAALLWKKYVKSDLSWQRIQTYEKQEYWNALVEAWLRFCEPNDISDAIRVWLNANLGFCIERFEAIGIEHMKEIVAECVFDDLAALGPIGGRFQGEDVMDLANYILGNRLFELTASNVYVGCELTSNPFGDLKSAEYVTMSDVLSSGNEGFKAYVQDNIKEVFTHIFAYSKGLEDEIGVVYILNEENLDEKQKTEYLKRQPRGSVIDINDIKDAYKPLTIKCGGLYASWLNVRDYFTFEGEQVSEILEDFINDNVDKLLESDYPANNGSGLAAEIVYGGHLSLTVYEKLLPVLVPHVGAGGEGKLSKNTGIERIKLLVKNNYLSDSVETAKVVAQLGAPMYAEYLSSHFTRFISNYGDYDIDAKTLAAMINKDSSLRKGQRWNLAKKVTADFVGQDAELANGLLVLMLKRKEELSWTTVEAILKKATLQPQKQQFQEWLIKGNLNSVEKVRTILKTMRYPYCDIVDDSNRPLIPKDFKVYLDLLAPMGFFTSCKEEKNGYRIFHSTKLRD